jgi:hypothetical protein
MARLTKSEKIIAIELEIEQLSNQKKQLEAQERERTRKERTTRLCKRAGLLESLLPDTIALTEDNFKLFLEKTVANDFGRRTLANLKVEQATPSANNGAAVAAQGGVTTPIGNSATTSAGGATTAARTTETPKHGATS